MFCSVSSFTVETRQENHLPYVLPSLQVSSFEVRAVFASVVSVKQYLDNFMFIM